jgi:hypothetical protein
MMRKMLAGCVAMAVVMACGAAAFGVDKDDVMAAAKKLADAPNYTFTTNQTGGMGGGGQRRRWTRRLIRRGTRRIR